MTTAEVDLDEVSADADWLEVLFRDGEAGGDDHTESVSGSRASFSFDHLNPIAKHNIVILVSC